MNCWIWLILLWCFSGNCGCGNGGCQNDRMRNERRNNEPSPRDSDFQSRGNSGCGCDNDMIQPRGFAGFGDDSTCGCEEKENSQR